MPTNQGTIRSASGHLPDVFSPREIARTAGVPLGVVRELIASAEIATIDGELVAHQDAVAAVRSLRGGRREATRFLFGATVFALRAPSHRSRPLSFAGSTLLHAALLLGAVAVTTVQLGSVADAPEPPEPTKLVRLVFVAEPGPGGGGGGGGLQQPAPPPKARREGTNRLSSPVPKRPPPERIEVPKEPELPKEPPVLENDPLPPLVGPLVSVAADAEEVLGSLDEGAPETGDSQGPGSGGGTGAGTGTGVGEGTGAGVGAGSGGGTGGGPYRPGSGIEPPRVLHEVKPAYTEQARRAGLEGEVVLEIVVRRDGTVSDVRVLRRLGSGLDEEAVRAVRQWRFAPAERFGDAVDVVVEVAMEFRLR